MINGGDDVAQAVALIVWGGGMPDVRGFENKRLAARLMLYMSAAPGARCATR